MPIAGRVVFIALTLAVPAAAVAQPTTASRWTPEISLIAGLGHVFRWEDRTYGDRWNVGGAAAMAHDSGFVIEVAGDRTTGLEPPAAPCGLVNVPCVGAGHDGPLSVAVASATLQYRFKRKRVQPYVLAGLGVMWSRSLHSETRVTAPSVAVITEHESRDRGFGPELGAGVRLTLGPHVAVSPEVRWLDAPWLSAQNLAITRLGVRVSSAW